jgi:hypothetical protein
VVAVLDGVQQQHRVSLRRALLAVIS